MKEMNVEERACKAREFFNSGYNCCQSVVMAFADITGLAEPVLAQAAAGFGGGFGRLREVCGTVSGMTMLAGFISPVPDPSDQNARKANYALVQQFAEQFRKLNGSIVCRDLLGLAPNPHESPAPEPRTPEYYHKRPCGELVYIAATIVAEYLASK